MSVSNRWAIQEVFDITLIEPVNALQVYCVLEDLKNCTFANEGTTVYASGGKGNPKLVGFDHSKTAKFTIGSAMFLSDLWEVQSGTAPVTGSNTNYVKTETLTVSSNTLTLSATPLGTAGSELGYVYIVATDGSLSTQLEQDSIVSSGKFTVSGKTVTLNTGDYADGVSVFVKYNATTASDTITYSNYCNVFSKNVKLVADTVVKNCQGVEYAAQLIFYNAKVDNNFSFDLTADGEPAVMNFEVEALKTCTSEKLWDLIVYNSSTVT